MKKLLLAAALSVAVLISGDTFAQKASYVDPSWQTSLVQQLQRFKRYPAEAQTRFEQGAVLLSLSLDRNGHVLAHSIARSSGHADLDNEVMEMIKRAEPLPPFPASMTQARIDLTVPIQFSLSSTHTASADDRTPEQIAAERQYTAETLRACNANPAIGGCAQIIADTTIRSCHETHATTGSCAQTRQQIIDAIVAFNNRTPQQIAADNAKIPISYGYRHYMVVRYCNEIRQGYLLQYVNDVEFERATVAIKAIVNAAKAANPSIDTDEEWKLASKVANGTPITQETCQMHLAQLLRLSPLTVYSTDKPQD